MSTATNVTQIGLRSAIDFNQTAEKNGFLSAISQNAARVLQKPVLIASADVCSKENVNSAIEKANSLADRLDGLNQRRVARRHMADQFRRNSPEWNDVHRQGDEFYTQMRDIRSSENADGQYLHLNTIFLECKQLSPADRKRLEEAIGKLDHAMQIQVKHSKSKLAPKTSPTPTQQRIPTPQMPQFSIPPDLLPFLFRIITGSEQRA